MPLAAKNYHVVVKPGENIQKAIEKAPEHPDKPFVILIKNGAYRQKVIIDKPNIVLLGENRDSVRIIYPETASTIKQREYKGKRVSNGVIVLTEEANDCVITGLTVYNNYGTTIEHTTTHQMTIFGRATRTIVVNCNVWGDGNDTMSLWGGGFYYHADCDIRSRGVDFVCPRGWCYATRCLFYGDGHAMLWHDGRGNVNKKFVMTDSYIDAKRYTEMGRFHHDSQFYFLNCTIGDSILNQPISYAYRDKMLDPCTNGFRFYHYNFKAEHQNCLITEKVYTKNVNLFCYKNIGGYQCSYVTSPLARRRLYHFCNRE